MYSKLNINKPQSATLRMQLENQLVTMFSGKTISKYLAMDSCETEPQIIQNFNHPSLTFPQIKLAYQIWLGMDAADRHHVLGKFNCLYNALTVANTRNQETLVFCALFVHEFADILAENMEWPD